MLSFYKQYIPFWKGDDLRNRKIGQRRNFWDDSMLLWPVVPSKFWLYAICTFLERWWLQESEKWQGTNFWSGGWFPAPMTRGSVKILPICNMYLFGKVVTSRVQKIISGSVNNSFFYDHIFLYVCMFLFFFKELNILQLE